MPSDFLQKKEKAGKTYKQALGTTHPVLVCRFFQIFLFSGESHLANFNFSKPFFQSNWKVKIKTHLNNIRIFQNLVFLFSGKRLFLQCLRLFVGFSSFFFFLEKVTWQILIFPPKIKQVEIFHRISPFSGKTIIFPNFQILGKRRWSYVKSSISIG